MKGPFSELILKKKRGHSLTETEISDIIKAYSIDKIPDYQMSALLMAICFVGLSKEETLYFTEAMRNSGNQFEFKDLYKKVVDKHSTGGVGDKTSLILGPILAAAGLYVPMLAGRGLGHTGGTLDKLESLSGFDHQVSFKKFDQIVRNQGLVMAGQSLEICPADRKLYALRDVTGTVDQQGLIVASIMSKKLSEGISALVLDVKSGTGAFMKNIEQAKGLAESLVEVGQAAGLKIKALITNMNQPLGRFVGNALEVKECLSILKGEDPLPYYEETKNLSLELAARLIELTEMVKTPSEAMKLAEKYLENGQAYAYFEKMAHTQGAKLPLKFAVSNKTQDLLAKKDGYFTVTDCEQIGLAAIDLKAGRRTHTDKIDHRTGIEMVKKMGDPVKKGETMVRLYSDNQTDRDAASQRLENCLSIVDEPPQDFFPLILDELSGKGP